MKHAIVSGTFDPMTIGHADVIRRAAQLFDTVTVAVVDNAEKRTLFTAAERLEIAERAIAAIGETNVSAVAYSGLTSDLMREKNIKYIVRGVRNASDFDYEYGMAQIMREFSPGSETVFLPALPEHMHISSTYVRERITHKSELEGFVPDGCAALPAEIYERKTEKSSGNNR